MPRLTLQERQALMHDINGHYEEVLQIHPGWEIAPGFGLPQMRDLEATYNAKQSAIETIENTGMPAKRAQCDALFGYSNEDTNGLWLYLTLYKMNVRQTVGAKSPLSKTVPHIGVVRGGTYAHVLKQFRDHWRLVNAALAQQTPPQPEMTIGPITLAELESRLAQITELSGDVDETVMTGLGVMRAEREQIFGDVREDERSPESFLGRAETYRTRILTEFAGTPLAATVPRLFPQKHDGKLPRFAFNFRVVGAQITLWWAMPDDLDDAAVIYLKEGAFEETRAIPASPPLVVTFDGVDIHEALDEVELRDSAGKTIAEGHYDAQLVEPL